MKIILIMIISDGSHMKRIVYDLKKYIYYAFCAGKASLKAEVAGSKLNWIWWVLEPFCYMLIYTVVFGYIFQSKEQYRALFIFLGISIWQFFSKSIRQSVNVMKKNKQIIGKVYLPKYILVIQTLLVNGFKMFISLGISFGLIVFYRVGFHWGMLRIIPILVGVLILTFAICCFMLHFGLYMTDLSNIADIVLRFLTYFVGVFYAIENKLPQPFNLLLVKWNPIAFYLNSARCALIYNTAVDWKMYAFWTLMSCVFAYIGIQMIYKNENSYIKVL